MSTTRSSQDEVLDLIGQVVAGLAVPYSLSMEATRGRPEVHLGTAARAWVELRDELHLFGWSRPEEVTEALRRALAAPVPEGGTMKDGTYVMIGTMKDGVGEFSVTGSLPQRQDSLADQLRDLVPVASRLGMYDAAEFIRRHLEKS